MKVIVEDTNEDNFAIKEEVTPVSAKKKVLLKANTVKIGRRELEEILEVKPE